MAHGIASTDLVKASHLQVLSGRYIESAVGADIDNGRVVKLMGMVSGERELYQTSTPTAVTTDRIYFVRTPEVMYRLDETGLENFYNVADSEIRLYPLVTDDIFGTSNSNIDTTIAPAVGKYLIPVNNSNKLKVANDLSGNTAFAAEIIEVGVLGYNRLASTFARVIKNA